MILISKSTFTIKKEEYDKTDRNAFRSKVGPRSCFFTMRMEKCREIFREFSQENNNTQLLLIKSPPSSFFIIWKILKKFKKKMRKFWI